MKKNKKNNNNKLFIILYVVISCVLMAFIELIVEPNYLIKSLIKILLFFGIPFIIIKIIKIKLLDNFKVNKKELVKLLKLGVGVFLVGIITYLVFRNFIDFTKLTRSLLVDQHITRGQFILVALYISFGNSLLEEFIFRLVSFIKLKEYCNKRFAYIFSAFMFSIYHAAMIGMSFPFLLTLFCLICLFVLGILFNYLDDKDNNIYNSWFVHMFCDFAIMVVAFLHL